MTREFRYRIVRLSPWFLLQCMKYGTNAMKVVANALPSDTEFVRAGHDHTGWLYFVVSSHEFDMVPEGAQIPEHPAVVFEKA